MFAHLPGNVGIAMTRAAPELSSFWGFRDGGLGLWVLGLGALGLFRFKEAPELDPGVT